MDAAVFVAFDQFPVTHTDGARGESTLIAVVRIVPVEGVAIEIATFEERHEVRAIDCSFGLAACGFHEGREEVGAHHRNCAGRAGPGDAGPLDDERLADSSFINPALAASQGEVGSRRSFRGGETAVVRGEANDDLVFETQFLDFLHNLANGLVHCFHHRGIDGVLLQDADFAWFVAEDLLFITELLSVDFFGLLFVFRNEIGSSDQRSVNRVEREHCEEGLLLVGLHE